MTLIISTQDNVCRVCVSVHQNYVGCDSEKAPFFLSVVLTDANNQCVPQYRAILWKKTVGACGNILFEQFIIGICPAGVGCQQKLYTQHGYELFMGDGRQM